VRALEGSTEARPWGVVRREGEPTFAQALAEAEVDVVAVCTPNRLHPDQVQAALAAGKHVLCEYPLAARVSEARKLLGQAHALRRVLHVGYIGLLTESHREQRVRAGELGRPVAGRLEFRGGMDGWIGDPAQAGSPALCAEPRLHQLLDLFGAARVSEATLERDDSGYRLEVRLRFESGGETVLEERRARGGERSLRYAIECERGLLGDPAARSAQGIFALDLGCLVARVRQGEPSYVAESRILHVLELVGQIERLVST